MPEIDNADYARSHPEAWIDIDQAEEYQNELREMYLYPAEGPNNT